MILTFDIGSRFCTNYRVLDVWAKNFQVLSIDENPSTRMFLLSEMDKQKQLVTNYQQRPSPPPPQ